MVKDQPKISGMIIMRRLTKSQLLIQKLSGIQKRKESGGQNPIPKLSILLTNIFTDGSQMERPIFRTIVWIDMSPMETEIMFASMRTVHTLELKRPGHTPWFFTKSADWLQF